MRIIIYLLFGIALTLLNGCSFNGLLDGVNDINPDQPINLAPGTGMIVGSVTAPKVLHYWEISKFRYRKLGESKSGVLESASPTANFLWMKDSPLQPGGTGPDMGLEQQLGRLFAVEMPAGKYEIYQLDATVGATGILLIHMPPVRFDVRSGEVLYLGNLHVKYCLYYRDPPVWYVTRSFVNGGIPSVRDEAQRDLPLLTRKFPVLNGVKITPAIINDDAWKNLEKTGLPSPYAQC